MGKINKYNSLAAYNAAAKDANAVEVSKVVSEVMYDMGSNANVILPFKANNLEVGDIVVYDKQEQKKKVLKWITYNSATLDTNRYVVSDSNYIGTLNNKGIFVSAKLPTGGTSVMWAEKAYFRITGFDLTQGGSFTFSVKQAATTYNGVVVTYEADATLESIAAAILTALSNNTYITCVKLADGTGIGLSVDRNYAASTPSVIFNITAKTGGAADVEVEYMNKIGDTEVVLQSFATNTLISGRKAAINNGERNNGTTAYLLGANWTKFIQYYTTNGESTFKAESNATPMKKTVFDGLAESEVPEQLALYNKYGGDYSAYLNGYMGKEITAKGIIANDYDDFAAQTALLGSVMTKNYNNEDIAAFPFANKIVNYGISTEGVVTGFEAGNFAAPSTKVLQILMPQVGYDSSHMTDLNKAFAKVSGATNIYGSGTYIWACSEHSAYIAWSYGGSSGAIGDNIKNGTFQSRPVLALELE